MDFAPVSDQRDVPSPIPIIERDDGQFQIGIVDDAPGPFPTRAFACAVATQRAEAAWPP